MQTGVIDSRAGADASVESSLVGAPAPTSDGVPAGAPQQRKHRRISAGRVVKETLLTIAGIGGMISLAWFVASSVFGLSIVIFMTGSMSPTLPTGSAAIVKDDVPATELRVGDIVTVPRAGQPLPVTHRIVGIDTADAVEGAGVGARVLTLRGDDNETNDRETYTVTDVDRVLVGAPHLGYVLHTVQTPLFFGGLTLVVALLVVWAFWPKEGAERQGRRNHRNPRRHAKPRGE